MLCDMSRMEVAERFHYKTIGEKYALGRVLGTGELSEVRLAKDMQSGGRLYAVKIIPVAAVNTGRVTLEQLDREVETLELCRGRSVVRCHDFLRCDACFYMVMDYCPNGTLFSHIRLGRLSLDGGSNSNSTVAKHLEYERQTAQGESYSFTSSSRDCLSALETSYLSEGSVTSSSSVNTSRTATSSSSCSWEDTSRHLFRQLVRCVHHIHSCGVAHRDIKPENFLLDEEYNLVLSDFGYAVEVPDPEEYHTTCCGTPHYMAPEVIAEHYRPFPADVWSCGVVLYVLVSGKMPFYGSSLEEVLQCVQKGAYRSLEGEVSPMCWELIKRILVCDPANRATLEDIMKDPWYTGERPDGKYKFVGSSPPLVGCCADTPTSARAEEEMNRFLDS